MRIYKNCKEMLNEEFRNLFELGVDVQSSTVQDIDVRDDEKYLTKELIANLFSIISTKDFREMHSYAKKKYKIDFNKEWCDAEFEERISSREINPGLAWMIRRSIWKKFLHDNKFSYTYNERIRKSLAKAIKQLKENRSSRQAVISIFDSKDMNNAGGKKRIPCSMFYQFFIRKDENNQDELVMIYVMRSSDLLTHFVNDVYLAIKMMNHVADNLDVKVGMFYMLVSSLHSFYKDLKKYGIF